MSEKVSEHSEHEWVWLSELQPGDRIHRWGDDLEVIEVTSVGRGFLIKVIETDGSERIFDYNKDGQYIVLRKEIK